VRHHPLQALPCGTDPSCDVANRSRERSCFLLLLERRLLRPPGDWKSSSSLLLYCYSRALALTFCYYSTRDQWYVRLLVVANFLHRVCGVGGNPASNSGWTMERETSFTRSVRTTVERMMIQRQRLLNLSVTAPWLCVIVVDGWNP
jgi:hypothetical protein